MTWGVHQIDYCCRVASIEVPTGREASGRTSPLMATCAELELSLDSRRIHTDRDGSLLFCAFLSGTCIGLPVCLSSNSPPLDRFVSIYRTCWWWVSRHVTGHVYICTLNYEVEGEKPNKKEGKTYSLNRQISVVFCFLRNNFNLIYIIREFLQWLSKNRRLISTNPTATKVEEPKGTNWRGTKCILNGGTICTKSLLKLVGSVL